MSDTKRLHALLKERGITWSTFMNRQTEWNMHGLTFEAVVREGAGEVILTAYPVTVDDVAALMERMDGRSEE
jgi:hypothetical protein